MAERPGEIQDAKQLVWDVFTGRGSSPLAREVAVEGPAAVGALAGHDAVHRAINEPLLEGILDPYWSPDVFAGGYSSGDLWVAHTGTLTGIFTNELWGIPPSGRKVSIRYGEFARVEAGSIVELRALVDLPGFAAQAGYHVIPHAGPIALGISDRSARDLRPDAMTPDPEDTAQTARLLDELRRRWSQRSSGEGVDDLWHPDLERHGSHGIEAVDWVGSLDHHSLEVGAVEISAVAPQADVFVAEGQFAAVATKSPSVRSAASGLASANDPAGLRTMAFFTRRGDRFGEAWLLVDLVDAAAQCGVDLLPQVG